MSIKKIVKSIPVLGPALAKAYRARAGNAQEFKNSEEYWKRRYAEGGNSGDGSYSLLAEFKAEVLNKFVAEKGIGTVIEFGSGDGNQLSLAKYPKYLGFDVSPEAVAQCQAKFAGDTTKAFKLVGDYSGETAELTMSLDVVFHLVEDAVYLDYMTRLFDSSERYVVVFSSDTDDNGEDPAPHVRHRRFSSWIAAERPSWKLIERVPNKYPYQGDTRTGSFADFYFYEKSG